MTWLKSEIWEAIRQGAPRHPEIAVLKTEIEEAEERQREQEAEKRRVEAEKQRVIAEEEAERKKAREIQAKKRANLVKWTSIGAVVVGGSVYVAYQYQEYRSLPVHAIRAESKVCLRMAEQIDELVPRRNAMAPSPERDELASHIEDLEYDQLPKCRSDIRRLERDLGVSEAEAPNNFLDYLVSGSN